MINPSWTFNHRKKNDQSVDVNRKSLHITHVQRKHAGYYYCIGQNDLGLQVNGRGLLNVLGNAYINKVNQPVQYQNTYTCSVLQIFWLTTTNIGYITLYIYYKKNCHVLLNLINFSGQ